MRTIRHLGIMAKTELTITVDGLLSISDETAERCLRLLELWHDDNPDKYITCEEIMLKDRIAHKYSIKCREPVTSVIFQTMNEQKAD